MPLPLPPPPPKSPEPCFAGAAVLPKGEAAELPVVEAPTFPKSPAPDPAPVFVLPAVPKRPAPDAPLEAGGSKENILDMM